MGVHLISKDACLQFCWKKYYVYKWIHKESCDYNSLYILNIEKIREESKYLRDEKIHGHALILTDQMGRVGRIRLEYFSDLSERLVHLWRQD